MVDRRSGERDTAREMSDCIRMVAVAQDRTAFETLFRHFAPRVKAYLVRAGGNAAAAEELMQETMVTVWRKADLFDPGRSSASTWIFTIARNLRIDAFRHERRPELDPNDPALVPEDEPPADASLESRQTAEIVGAAIAGLSSAEQAVLRLAYFEDQPQSAIAEELGIPLGTVKSRIRLAFGKLRAAIAEKTGDLK